ncbi:DUF1643 domain-containing protein [Acinetobacter wuhouensis]|uniref:DUF1643 domain-containing protein n=1 Tax=Acinetobacter wuhouensis TaxID=1879050 RepID=A0A3G2T5J8_9GAMM|nr:DUF1643 domain-containing protein [Acinetobacter wuhouensis]AYO55538.1 DUF1643 domain-containing protein [Acinetobacter wuhouensis]
MNFNVNGFFYTDDRDDLCRKYLDISRKNYQPSKPQLMVVMMNPGSSKPIGELKNNVLIPTKPDPTQFQIMKIMDKKNIDFARVINLSDLREPSSSMFYSKIKNGRQDHKHSIFDESREEDLNDLFVKDVPIIFAWGVNSSLDQLTKLAVSKLKISNPLGILKNNNKYYHARPWSVKKQQKWVNDILDQMNI